MEIVTDIMKTGFLRVPVAICSYEESDIWGAKDLMSIGAAALVVPGPIPDGLAQLDDAKFIRQPASVHWRKAARPVEEEFARREDLTLGQRGKRLADHTRKLRKSEDFRVEIGPLSSLAFDEWYEIYERAIVNGKDGWGIRGLPADFDCREDGVSLAPIERRFGFLLREGINNRLVGGYVVEILPEDNITKIRAVAFEPCVRLARCQLSYRGLNEVLNFTVSSGLKFISYGHDPNFYGEFVSPGLARFKLSSGFRPERWRTSGQSDFYTAERILRVINPSAFREPIMTFGYDIDGRLALFHYGVLPDDFPLSPELSVKPLII